jgi:hypothetical protein
MFTSVTKWGTTVCWFNHIYMFPPLVFWKIKPCSLFFHSLSVGAVIHIGQECSPCGKHAYYSKRCIQIFPFYMKYVTVEMYSQLPDTCKHIQIIYSCSWHYGPSQLPLATKTVYINSFLTTFFMFCIITRMQLEWKWKTACQTQNRLRPKS